MLPGSRARAANLVLGLVAAVTLSSPVWAAGPLDAFLPKDGKIQGHIMSIGVAPEDQAIDKQFRGAVQNNMEWFKKFVQGQKPGQPLPYDRRMGITEAQYERLQKMRADFRAGDPVEIEVVRDGEGRVSFASKSDHAAELAKVTFGPQEKVAETPYGKLAIFSEINQRNPNAPLGVWKGVEWAKVEQDGAETPSAKIAFGKRSPSGEGVMYYQIAAYKDGREKSLVIFYKLD